jgi:ParB-like chromosome segregation protein Spo0J
MQMPDKIVLRSVESLIPYARNARSHSDAQVAQIAGSIRELGFTNPVLLDDENGIIAGHGRVLAARKLGMTEVPCIELAHLSPVQRRAYILADNKLALNAGWDDEMLRIELGELSLGGFETGTAAAGARPHAMRSSSAEGSSPMTERTGGP